MGVPAFFRWLSRRYPKIVIDAVEPGQRASGTEERIEAEEPDVPAFDNLYLDMNGIIHPCCHPEDGSQPQTEAEMFNNIFLYIDKLMRIVRPRRLVYMAVDGVAPRAKMNQQRSRRFRAAFDIQAKVAKEAELQRLWAEKGLRIPDALQKPSQCTVVDVIC
jgi:5'-3' exoribonuclease 2